MVQRLLSAKNIGDARKALFGSWAVIFFQFALFLVIGLILWKHYLETGAAPPQPADRIYPEFIWKSLPPGVSGLVIAAILAAAMSNLSAALNSLASTTVMDFYKLKFAQHSEKHYLKLARMATLAWGVVLFAIGVLSRHVKSVLEAGLGIASILYGALLGVFLLGVLTQHVSERSAMAGMLAGLAVNLYLRFATPVAWTWYVLVGAVTTAGVALAVSAIADREEAA